MVKAGSLIFIFLVLLGIFFSRYHKANTTPNFYLSPNPSFGYEDCVRSEGAKISEGYPKKCQTSDSVSYFQEITEPVNTEWETINTTLGFSLKCPPYWSCKKLDENSAAIHNPNYNISTFQVDVINPENFQQSDLRHPNYKNPINWFNDLKTKKEISIKVFPETIKPVPGTDGLLYPAYNHYDLNNLTQFDTNLGSGFRIPANDRDTNIFIPLDRSNLIFITLAPVYLIENPVIKSIIQSITLSPN